MNSEGLSRDRNSSSGGVGATGFEVARVGDVPFRVATFQGAVGWLVDVAAVKHLPINVRLANAWNVALTGKDVTYRELLVSQGVNFPDGTPVAWLMNVGRSGRAKAERVRGPSFFTAVLMAGTRRNLKHFLLGGSPETLVELQKALRERYPGVQIVGAYSPPFAPVDDDYIEDCAARIVGEGADVVWIGLGTPKQDVVGTALAAKIGITTINVGAAFDFCAGTVTEAPEWIQRSGFEWLFRLLAEPRRLWRRYLIGNVEFLWVALRSLRTQRAAAKCGVD